MTIENDIKFSWLYQIYIFIVQAIILDPDLIFCSYAWSVINWLSRFFSTRYLGSLPIVSGTLYKAGPTSSNSLSLNLGALPMLKNQNLKIPHFISTHILPQIVTTRANIIEFRINGCAPIGSSQARWRSIGDCVVIRWFLIDIIGFILSWARILV